MNSLIVLFVAISLFQAALTANTCKAALPANPCITCKWFIPGSEPKCGFYKTTYNVLGKKLIVHEYAEHVRKNEHMCGKEGYMYEPRRTIQ